MSYHISNLLQSDIISSQSIKIKKFNLNQRPISMPSFLIIEQIHRNTLKVLSCISGTIQKIWGCIDKYSTKFANGWNKEIVGRITRKAHKYTKCLRILAVILAIMALISGLFLGSFKSVGAREQGLEINYTEQVLKQTYITNDWKYTGLNGYMKVVPIQAILIEFNSRKFAPEQQQKTNQIYQPIEARVVEGTKLLIEGTFQCNIVIRDNKDTNIKAFFDNYGFNKTPGQQSEIQWMTYLRQKITNVIVQVVGKQSFYSITNQNIKNTINSQFSQIYSQFNLSFPFKISVLSLTVNYPPNSFPINNTLGVQLLKAKSILNQLSNQYEIITNYTKNQTNVNKINSTYLQNAQLSASINSRLMQIYSFNSWLLGLDLAKLITLQSSWPNNSPQSSTNIEKFMWLYFNNLYNQTYRLQKLNSKKASFSHEQISFLEQPLSPF